jgi:methyl-accepting chemotaxis protein
MSNLSIRARLAMLVGLFSTITLTLSLVSITNLGTLRDTINESVVRWAQASNMAMTADRDFEATNGEQNGLPYFSSEEDANRRMQTEDRLFKSIDEQCALLEKLLPGELLGQLNRFKVAQEEYRRNDNALRKVVRENETGKATALYQRQATSLLTKLREQLRRGAEKLDAAKNPKAGVIARDLTATLLSIHNELGNMLLETNEAELEEASKRLGAMMDQPWTELEELRDADPEGNRLAQRIAPLLDEYRKYCASIESGTRANSRTRAQALSTKGDIVAREAVDSITQIINRTAADLELAKRDSEALASHSRSLQLMLSLVGCLGGAVFAIFTVLRVNRGVETVRRVATEVAGSAGELQQATQSISQRTNEEASSLEETSSTMEEMTSAVEQNRAGAAKAKNLTEQNREAARQGMEIASQATEAMRALKDAGTRIGDISTTVSELAFQTNILALNASVEAARAGEHGRGFTVVASEVRTLAQRSGVAAREISTLIKDSLQRIERSVDLVGRNSQEMTRIMEMSREVTLLVGNISSATQEQASGISLVSQSIMQLNQVVQANSAQSEEMAATAESLDFQSQELVRAVAMISGTVDEISPRKPQNRRGGDGLGGAVQMRSALRDGAAAGSLKGSAPSETSALNEPIHSDPPEGDFRSF